MQIQKDKRFTLRIEWILKLEISLNSLKSEKKKGREKREEWVKDELRRKGIKGLFHSSFDQTRLCNFP